MGFLCGRPAGWIYFVGSYFRISRRDQLKRVHEINYNEPVMFGGGLGGG